MQAPTDNLYKFIAISGLICYLFFFFDFTKRDDALRSKVSDFSLMTVEAEARIKSIDDLKKGMQLETERLAKTNASLAIVERHAAKVDDLQTKILEADISAAKRDEMIMILSRLIEDLGEMRLRYAWLKAFSLGVFIVGLNLWYFKTQRYLDAKEKDSSKHKDAD